MKTTVTVSAILILMVAITAYAGSAPILIPPPGVIETPQISSGFLQPAPADYDAAWIGEIYSENSPFAKFGGGSESALSQEFDFLSTGSASGFPYNAAEMFPPGSVDDTFPISPIPEPTSLILLGVALVGLGGQRLLRP